MKVHNCGCESHHGHQGEHHEHGGDFKKEGLQIGFSAILLVAGMLLEDSFKSVAVMVFLISYLLLGIGVLMAAGKNIVKGHVFDENFLMSIATLAAFAIGDFAEAVGIMLFYRIGEWFEEIAVNRSRSQIMEVVDLRPETVVLVDAEGDCTIPATEAKVGDVLLVRVGDRIPLDGLVVEGESRIDTAPVTGEPIPVQVAEGDRVISGCVNTSGVLRIRVEKTLEQSMVTRILHSVEHAVESKPKMDRFITRFAKGYTPIVVVVAVATAVIPSLFAGDWEKWIYTAITFLVISCPCAIVLSIPLTFFAGIGAGSNNGILFKSGLAIEALKEVKVVVLDKTGTVTKGTFEVQKCVAAKGWREEDVLALAAACEVQSAHPIANSIVEEARRRKLLFLYPKQQEEIAGKGIRAVTDDGEILCGNQALLEQFGVETDGKREADYGTEVLVAYERRMIGSIAIADSLKEESKEAITGLHARKVKTVMLTGDGWESAETVAKETGIEEVYAKLLPEGKLEQLKKVRERYGKVLFVGDGINDAPVLAGADVGAAMGSGADAAMEAADVVFMTSSLQAICEAMDIAKYTNQIATWNIVFALGIKALVMLLGFFGFANMWLAVFADTGVAMLCVLNSVRILRRK